MKTTYKVGTESINIEYKFAVIDFLIILSIILGVITIFFNKVLIAFLISLAFTLLYDIKNIFKIVFYRFKTYVLTFGKIIKMIQLRFKGGNTKIEMTTDDKVMFTVIVMQIIWIIKDIVQNNFGIWSIAIIITLVSVFFIYNILIGLSSNIYSLIYKILLLFKSKLGLKMYLKRLQRINEKLLEIQKLQKSTNK